MEVAAVEGGDSGETSLGPPEKEEDREEMGLDTAESEVASEDAGVMDNAAGRCGLVHGLDLLLFDLQDASPVPSRSRCWCVSLPHCTPMVNQER